MAAAVGIDIGTSNTKVVRVRHGVGTVMLNRPTPVRLDELLTLVFAGIGRATEKGPVEAVGIASMAESGFALGADGRALTPLISWREAREDDEIRALAGRLGADALFEATGVRPGPKPSLAAWLWLRARHPDTFASMRRWAGAADAVHLALTGELRTDHTLAGRTLAYRLPPTGEPLASGFDPELLAETGLTADRLPRVGLPGEPPAATTRVSTVIGLRVGTPVVVAGHDHQVAAWAAEVRAVGQVADSVGTAEALLTLVGRAPDRPAVRAQGMSVVRAVDGTTEALLAGSGTAGGFLQWLADRHTDGDVSQLLTGHEPARAEALAGDSWLLPYPAGRQCPAPDPHAGVRMIGPPPVHLGVAGLEAVSYQAQWVLDTQAALAGLPVARLSLSGGPLHRTPLWARIKATLADVPTTLTAAVEPVATGAALLALQRAGLGDEPPLSSGHVEPLEGLRDRYRERLAAFVASAGSRPARP